MADPETIVRKPIGYLPTCGTCEHLRYCPTWTEYKCVKLKKTFKDFKRENAIIGRECYEPCKTQLAIDRKCLCDDCMSRGDLDDEVEK